MAAGGGSGGAARRPIAAAGGSICYSHGRDLAPARPAQPPQPRDQPQVRPRCSPRAVAALTWSGGPPAGFLTAPSAGSRVRLAEQWKEEKCQRASAGHPTRERPRAGGRGGGTGPRSVCWTADQREAAGRRPGRGHRAAGGADAITSAARPHRGGTSARTPLSPSPHLEDVCPHVALGATGQTGPGPRSARRVGTAAAPEGPFPGWGRLGVGVGGPRRGAQAWTSLRPQGAHVLREPTCPAFPCPLSAQCSVLLTF